MNIYPPTLDDELFPDTFVKSTQTQAYHGTCRVCDKHYSTTQQREAKLCDLCAEKSYEAVRFVKNVLKSSQARLDWRKALLSSLVTADPIECQIIAEQNVTLALQQHRATLAWAGEAEKEIKKLGAN